MIQILILTLIIATTLHSYYLIIKIFMYKNFYKNILHKLNYWVVRKVCADFEGRLKRRRFKF